MNRTGVVIVLMSALVATAAVGALSLLRPASGPLMSAETAIGVAGPLVPDPNMDALTIPSFSWTTQGDEPITREDLVGHVTLLDFFFSSCPFICPPMSRNMKMAQDSLEGTGVRFLSVSVDPVRDTPERLREYADEIGADTSTWTFATGSREEVTRILTEGLLLAPPLEDPKLTINLDDGGTMANIMHPAHFILVGPDAEIVALYNGLSEERVRALVVRARAAAATVAD